MEIDAPTRIEYDLIEKLRNRLLDLELKEEQLVNQELLRWIRARDHDNNAAEKMFRNSISWRQEVDIEGLLSWQPDEMFAEKFPISISGFDYEGCPVVIFQPGKMDFRAAIDNGYLEEGLKYLYKQLEQLLCIVRKVSTGQDCMKKVTTIVDLEGFQFRQLRSRKLLEEFAKTLHMYEANYPETLKAAVIVNVPTIFALIYRILCTVLSSKTASKLQLHNSSVSKYSQEILKIMAPQEFPEKYGGTGNISTNLLSESGSAISNNN